MNKRDLQRAVKRGAKALDKHMPGWEMKINTYVLDMRIEIVSVQLGCGCGCIGAQLGPGLLWSENLFHIFGNESSYEDLEHMGFSASPTYRESDAVFAYLTQLWKEEVECRVTL